MAYNIVTIAGSLRKESFLKIAHALARLAPPSLRLEVITLRAAFPSSIRIWKEASHRSWVSFREKLQQSNGILFVDARIRPAQDSRRTLKNAIDVGSRPYGESWFVGKPVGSSAIPPGRSAASAPPSICRTSCPASAARSCSSRKFI